METVLNILLNTRIDRESGLNAYARSQKPEPEDLGNRSYVKLSGNEQYLSGKMLRPIYLACIQHYSMPTAIPFQTTDWSEIPLTEHPGEKGIATWKMIQFGDLRIRKVKYEPGYMADHWCRKGHIIYCIEGEMTTELEDGTEFILRQGMTYMVSDNLSTHRSRTKNGVTLFIVDGGFLNINPA